MPEVCVSRWRIVIGRAGGRDSNVRSASSNDVITRTPENSGRYLVTGSSTSSRPSSRSIITTADVIGLVIDAIRKIASGSSAAPAATSRVPAACRYSTRSALATTATAAGTRPSSTALWRNASSADAVAARSEAGAAAGACSIAHTASAAAAAAHVLSFGMRAILAIIVRHAPLRRVVPRALSRDRHHPVDAGLHPPARVLLELHPARELSRHRHRLPARLAAPAADPLVSARPARRDRGGRSTAPRGGAAEHVDDLLLERHGRTGGPRREHAAAAAALHGGRGALRGGRAPDGRRARTASAAARVRDQPRRQPRGRRRLRDRLVDAAAAGGLVRRRRRGRAAVRDRGAAPDRDRERRAPRRGAPRRLPDAGR